MVTKEDILSVKEKLFLKAQPCVDSDCIEFTGYKDSLGYGQFQFYIDGNKKNTGAHRAAYVIHNNEDISVKDVIMHSCDNPWCINPEHLSKGTHKTNVEDRVRKGRSASGKDNGRYKHGKYCKEKMGVT